MEKSITYLDNAATTRVRPEAAAVALNVMTEDFANPSSTHAPGKSAAKILAAARGHVAEAIGADPDRVYFTSGGTEADNLAVISGAESNKRNGRHVIVSAAEHDAVLKSARELQNRGFDVTYLSPDKTGTVTADAFAAALRDDTALASLMLVNNDTGAVNPVAAYAAEIRRRGLPALLHTDAAQGFGKLPVDVAGVDLLTVSGHKMHAPKGAGALYIRPGLKLRSLSYGGEQERGLRAGTENLPAISAFGEAARLMGSERDGDYSRVSALRELAVTELKERLPGVVFIGGGSPYILCLSLPGYRAEVLTTCLSDDGVAVSRSSACKKGARSHVLEAMRLPPDVMDGALRVSFSRYTTEAEAEYFVARLCDIAGRLVHR